MLSCMFLGKAIIRGTVNMLNITTNEKINSQIIRLVHYRLSKYHASFSSSFSMVSSSSTTIEAIFIIFLMYSYSTSSWTDLMVRLSAMYILMRSHKYSILSFFSSSSRILKGLPLIDLRRSNLEKFMFLIRSRISSTCASFAAWSSYLFSC